MEFTLQDLATTPSAGGSWEGHGCRRRVRPPLRLSRLETTHRGRSAKSLDHSKISSSWNVRLPSWLKSRSSVRSSKFVSRMMTSVCRMLLIYSRSNFVVNSVTASWVRSAVRLRTYQVSGRTAGKDGTPRRFRSEKEAYFQLRAAPRPTLAAAARPGSAQSAVGTSLWIF